MDESCGFRSAYFLDELRNSVSVLQREIRAESSTLASFIGPHCASRSVSRDRRAHNVLRNEATKAAFGALARSNLASIDASLTLRIGNLMKADRVGRAAPTGGVVREYQQALVRGVRQARVTRERLNATLEAALGGRDDGWIDRVETALGAFQQELATGSAISSEINDLAGLIPEGTVSPQGGGGRGGEIDRGARELFRDGPWTLSIQGTDLVWRETIGGTTTEERDQGRRMPVTAVEIYLVAFRRGVEAHYFCSANCTWVDYLTGERGTATGAMQTFDHADQQRFAVALRSVGFTCASIRYEETSPEFKRQMYLRRPLMEDLTKCTVGN